MLKLDSLYRSISVPRSSGSYTIDRAQGLRSNSAYAIATFGLEAYIWTLQAPRSDSDNLQVNNCIIAIIIRDASSLKGQLHIS